MCMCAVRSCSRCVSRQLNQNLLFANHAPRARSSRPRAAQYIYQWLATAGLCQSVGTMELPHLIQPVAQALSADRSLVSKLTRQRVCHEGFWTHASERGAAARKVEWAPALREFENFVGSRFTPACNTSTQYTTCGRKGWSPMYVYVHLRLSHGVSFIMADQGLLWAVKQTKM